MAVIFLITFLSCDPDSKIMITDFGLAKYVDKESQKTACGTPGYVGKWSVHFMAAFKVFLLKSEITIAMRLLRLILLFWINDASGKNK